MSERVALGKSSGRGYKAARARLKVCFGGLAIRFALERVVVFELAVENVRLFCRLRSALAHRIVSAHRKLIVAFVVVVRNERIVRVAPRAFVIMPIVVIRQRFGKVMPQFVGFIIPIRLVAARTRMQSIALILTSRRDDGRLIIVTQSVCFRIRKRIAAFSANV